MKVNKFGENSSLTFSCTAALYPNKEALPVQLANCQTNSRRRRESPNNSKQTTVTLSIPIRRSSGDTPRMSGAAATILQSIILIFVFV